MPVAGTGALTIALYEAFERQSMTPKTFDAFDLTPGHVAPSAGEVKATRDLT
jgi:hypothetical protein